MLMFGLGFPLLTRIVRLAKSQNITSIADFIGARYGKSQAVAAIGFAHICLDSETPIVSALRSV